MSESTLTEVRQALFSQAYEGLARQGFTQSMTEIDGEYSCAYRGESGRRCAVGHIIPDEHYDMNLEGQRASTIVEILGPDLRVPDDEGTVELLMRMQRAHDHYGITPEAMKRSLLNVAEDFGLVIPEVNHVGE